MPRLTRAKHKNMCFDDWFKGFGDNPLQRNTKERASREDIKKRFKTFTEEHFEVHGTILMNDDVDPVNGKEYKAGTEFKVDGHTRPEVVNNGDSNATPQDINEAGGFSVTITESENIQEVKDRYKRHDSAEAVEKRSDAVASAFRCAYANRDSAIPDNPMFMFTQPLSYAAHYTFGQKQFPKDSGLDQDLLSRAVKGFIPGFDMLENISFKMKKTPASVIVAPGQENIVWDRWLTFAALTTGFYHNWSDSWYLTVMRINNCDLTGLEKRDGEGSTALALLCHEWCQQRQDNAKFTDKRLNKGQISTKGGLNDYLFYLFDKAINKPNDRIENIRCRGYWSKNYKYNDINNLDQFF